MNRKDWANIKAAAVLLGLDILYAWGFFSGDLKAFCDPGAGKGYDQFIL